MGREESAEAEEGDDEGKEDAKGGEEGGLRREWMEGRESTAALSRDERETASEETAEGLEREGEKD